MKNKAVKRNMLECKVKFLLFTFTFLLFIASCNEIQSPKSEPFYGEMKVPVKQEVRWSNGTLPKTLDPAFAVGSPETDIIRAVFEGLTEADSKTLKPTPAIATKWTASPNKKVWTFQLRKDAKWSNDKSIVASDFVNSWKRLVELGNKVSHPNLLRNISGTYILETSAERDVFVDDEVLENVNSPKSSQINKSNVEVKKLKFGVEAIGDFVLKVTLNQADEDFPSLVSHPMFSPIQNAKEFESGTLNAAITTSGAFRITSIGKDGVTLDRAANYWNKEKISLNRVKFVPIETAEAALQAYRAGDVDVLTNFSFEPLALKLLKPFEDFKKDKFAAVNLYEFNKNHEPFDDVRVREAFAISFDRKRLSEDEMDGVTQPAMSYLPFNDDKNFAENLVKAKQLLTDAGFPNGQNFPQFRLVINRNDLQKRIANSVAKMWLQNLGIKVEVVIKSREEFETAQKTGDFELIRRGVVLPTTNEHNNLAVMFPPKEIVERKPESEKNDGIFNSNVGHMSDLTNAASNISSNSAANSNTNTSSNTQLNSELSNDFQDEKKFVNEQTVEQKLILSNEEAIAEIPAIPLYFPETYSLVKPYILGFETNILDAPSLKTVKINSEWKR